MARPTEYKTEYNEQVYKLCLLGATDKDIADFFEVCEATVNNWKKHKEFLESIKKGKAKADIQVAEKLHERATGYEWTETVAVKYKTGVGTAEDVKIVEVRKAAPPDPTSAIFWLKNRKSVQWRDKQEQEVHHRFEPLVVQVNGDTESPPKAV